MVFNGQDHHLVDQVDTVRANLFKKMAMALRIGISTKICWSTDMSMGIFLTHCQKRNKMKYSRLLLQHTQTNNGT